MLQSQTQSSSVCSEGLDDDDENDKCQDNDVEDTDALDGDESQNEKSVLCVTLFFLNIFLNNVLRCGYIYLYSLSFLDVWYNHEVGLLLELIQKNWQ